MEVFDQVAKIAAEAIARGDRDYALALLDGLATEPARRLTVEILSGLQDDPGVLEAARRFHAEFGADPRVGRDLGLAYFRLGNCESARLVLAAAAERDFDCVYRAMNAVQDERGAAWRQVVCEALACANPRIAQIARECPLLGRASAALSPRAEALITGLLDERAAALSNPSPPAWIAAHDWPAAPPPRAGTRMLLVFYGEADETDAFPHSALWQPIRDSALNAGLCVDSFNGRAFMYQQLPPIDPSEAERREALDRLKAKIADFAPDLILIDGNYATDSRTIDQAFMDEVHALGRPIVALIFDTDHHYAVDIDFWTRNCQCVVILNNSATLAWARQPEKIYRWPALPVFSPATFQCDGVKDLGLAFMGTNYRGRAFYFILAEALGAEIAVQITKQPGTKYPSFAEYAGFLARARMTFTTGAYHGNHGIVTGRVFEAILSKSLVFDEQGSGVEHIFHPFLHYIPIGNAHQLVIYAQYFSKHEARRRLIADAAYDWYLRYFDPKRFWSGIVGAAVPECAGLGRA